MAYFSALGGTGGTSATITVTYSEDFYGTTITATNGTTTLTKTATSSGEVVFTVSEGGTWIVSGVVEGSTYSEQVDVTFEYTTPQLFALPDGSTATPVNSIAMWLKCAMIRDKDYTTLSQVLNDTETFIALCADSNACDYMARSTNWASGVAADSTAMLIVGKYNYCANALLGNSTWTEALVESDYWEYVFDVSVPKMTSNTTPSGVADASANATNAWKVFDKDFTTYWNTTSLNNYVEYEFTTPIKLKAISFISDYSSASSYDRVKNFKVEAYNGNDWDVLITDTAEVTTSAVEQVFVCEGNNTYTKFRFYIIDSYAGNNIGLIELQFYGRTEKGYTGTVIHSAVEDTTYYVSGGSNVPFCTIASGDTETVLASTIESLKNQTITLYSSVAKDPTNLSNDYSKQIRITPNITEIYLMPLGVFYWYGSEVENNEGKSIASNLTDLSQVAPTVTRNKNTMVITEPNGRGEVYWNKYAGLTDAHVIYSATAQANQYTNAVVFSTTALPDHVQADWDNNYAIYMIDANESSIPLTHKNGTIKDRTYIKAWMSNNSANAETVTLHALWLE